MTKKHFLIVFVMILGLYAYYTTVANDMLKVKNQHLEQNLLASTDTIETLITKDGKQLRTITSYMYTIKELELKNDSLYFQMDSLGLDVETITVIDVRVKTDTIFIVNTDTVYIDKYNNATLNFVYDSSDIFFKSKVSMTVDGTMITNSTQEITDMTVSLKLKTGIYDDKGIKKFYVTSDNKSVIIDTVYGNIVPSYKKERKYGLGIGIGPNLSYDVLDKNITVGLGVTAGLIYKW
jgi:hypothetical protein